MINKTTQANNDLPFRIFKEKEMEEIKIADVFKKIKWFDSYKKKYIRAVIHGVYENGYRVSNYGSIVPFEDLKFRKNQISPYYLGQKIKHKGKIWKIDCLQSKSILLTRGWGVWQWILREDISFPKNKAAKNGN